MFKKIAIVLAVIIVGVLVLAAMQPDTFHFERAVTIDASPERIHPLISDLQRWSEWSPWEKLDPNMRRSFSGPASGPGAVYEWSGDGKVGAGRMEIVKATPTQVDIKLDFLEPMATSNTTRFVLSPEGGATKVAWSMDGPMPFLTKLMCVFVSLEKVLAPDFERGLADLKKAAEK